MGMSLDQMDYHTAAALLCWQVEMGVDEAIGDDALDRYELPDKQPKAPPAAASVAPVAPGAAPPPLPEPVKVDGVVVAEEAARAASDLEGLAAAMAAYEHCELKQGARQCVFSDGIAGAPVMIIGEAPGREEDLEGRPFVGRAGQLLDRMLAAIDRGRTRKDAPVYITNVMPWRPPQNRTPNPDEIAMMLPFLRRHIELARPKVLVLMGNVPCQALLGRTGITKMRGEWAEALGLPVLPMVHPAYLLRQPEAKREAWADLLALKAKLRELE